MLGKSASVILASLRVSMYGTEFDFASSLAAALLDGRLSILCAFLHEAISVPKPARMKSWWAGLVT
jgi:hypothetical protein